MKQRNFSMQAYWDGKFADWRPELSFKGVTKSDWMRWREQAYPKFTELLGRFPDKVDLDAEIEFQVEEDGLLRERVVFDSEEFMSVPCIVLKPVGMKPDRSNPAILCSHGHGLYGKDPVAGSRGNPDMQQEIIKMNYNYAEQMARAGFLTISPDLRVFGERSDGASPFPGRDKCNVNFIKGAILGYYTLALNIWDMMRCLDYLQTRPEVDPERTGMMGLSQGGTVTAFTAALDTRIKAADIIGYVNPWYEFGIRKANFCGSQIVPEIYRYFDTPDIAGLIAPRPLLIEMGIYDDCFAIKDLLNGYKEVEKIYEAAGAGDRIYSDICPKGHAFCGNKAFDFFRDHL